jgi:putative radical SAM enzyme (TIGR03279 family)
MTDLSLILTGETHPRHTGLVQGVAPSSLAAQLGLLPGDEVTAVNGQPVEDVIDVQFYAAEDWVEISYRRAGRAELVRGPRADGMPLGIDFAHPTFDIDIRRCNNLCPFCFVLQTAPHMRRTLYIKDDDYRYSFLYGHYVTLTNLNEHDWWRIEHQHLSPLYVSVHATDLPARRACLANPNAPDVLAQLHWLAQRGIECHTQVVVTPGLNDGNILGRSIRELARLYPAVRSVTIVPVGLTRHHKYGHRANTVEEAQTILALVAHRQADFMRKYGVRFVYATDEWYLATGKAVPPLSALDGLALEENGLGMVRNFLNAWRRERRELGPAVRRKLSGRTATLVTAPLFTATLDKTARQFNQLAGTRLRVVPIANRRLGDGITVAGLLMGQDVIDQLRGLELGEAVILPRVMFDHPRGISLDDISPLTIARQLDRPVYLADLMGDIIDVFAGENRLRFLPGDRDIAPEVMRAGGWAVEKYL